MDLLTQAAAAPAAAAQHIHALRGLQRKDVHLFTRSRRSRAGRALTRDGGGDTGRGGAACTARRAASGAKMATVTMSLCAWKHSYELFLSCAHEMTQLGDIMQVARCTGIAHADTPGGLTNTRSAGHAQAMRTLLAAPEQMPHLPLQPASCK